MQEHKSRSFGSHTKLDVINNFHLKMEAWASNLKKMLHGSIVSIPCPQWTKTDHSKRAKYFTSAELV
jgi:hypothetical protein